MHEDTVCKLVGKKKLGDKYNDSDLLPKINKANTVGMMEAIKEYPRSFHSIKRAHFTYIIRKTVTVQAYVIYPLYVMHDDKMIARMLHLLKK